MPSYREMAKALKVSAVGTIQDLVQILIERGCLCKDGRNLKLAENRSGPMFSVPIVGEVAAGALQDAYEIALGTLPISPLLLHSSKSDNNAYFALRVKGESMIEAGIHHGDFVVVRRNARVKSGDIIVAAWQGEATVKEVQFPDKASGNKVHLIPKNRSMKTIVVPADEDFSILGKVVCVQRYIA
jgi:repressor LexA